MRQIFGDNWHINAFDYLAHKAEANLLHIVCEDAQATRVAFGVFGDDGTGSRKELAKYIAVEDGTNFVADVDLSEYMRMLDAIGVVEPEVLFALYYWDEISRSWVNQDDDLEVGWRIVGLHNPVKLLRHPSWADEVMQCRWGSTTTYLRNVFPPKKLLGDDSHVIVAAFQYSAGFEVEPYALTRAGKMKITRTQGDKAVIVPSTSGQYGAATQFILRNTSEDDDEVVTMIDRNTEDRDTVAVRWMFPTGAEVQHALEWRDFKDSTNDSVSMDVLGEGFDTRKGIGQTFVLHLDNLEPYDYWYYGTIATSSKVDVNIAGEWRSVDVQTKKLDQPNTGNGKRKSLDIEVKLNDYKAL